MPNQYPIFEFVEKFKEAYKTIDLRAALIKYEDQWRIVCMALRIRIAPAEAILRDYQRETNGRKIDSQKLKIIQICLPFDDFGQLVYEFSKGELIVNGLKVILDAPKDLSKISGNLQFFTRSDSKPSVIDWPVLTSSIALSGTNPYSTVLQTDSAINRYVEGVGYDNLNSAIKNLLGREYEPSLIYLTMDLDVPARIDNIGVDRTGHNIISFKVNVTAHQALSDLQCNVFIYTSSLDKKPIGQLTFTSVGVANDLQCWAGEFDFKGAVDKRETLYFDLIYKDIGRLHWQEYRAEDIKIASDELAARTEVKAVPSSGLNIQPKLSERDPKTNDNDLKQYTDALNSFLGRFVKGGSMYGRFLGTEDAAQLKRIIMEVNDFLSELFGDNNVYSVNIINTVNTPTMSGSPSYAAVQDVIGILQAAAKKLKRQQQESGKSLSKDKTKSFALLPRQIDRITLTTELQRLIGEASHVAPTIVRFDESQTYGSVTDENLDTQKFIRWDIEVRTIIRLLANSDAAVFTELQSEYLRIKKESKKFHCRAILVHQVMELLISAKQLLDSPLSANKQHSPAKDMTNISNEATDITFLLHPTVMEHALPQLEGGHIRDAVLNSIIAVFDLIRKRTGLKDDGDKLIGKAFSLEDPYLIFSELNTESGQNDQKGFMQILKGAFQGIRNPKAHTLTHDLTFEKAVQYLIFASLMARRIDEALLVKKEDDL